MKAGTGFEYSGNTMRISADFDTVEEGQISFMIFHCLQSLSLKNSRYFVHGAAVQHEQEPYLFLGSPKAGKSTISLDLALNDGMKIYGDDSISLKVQDSILILNNGNTHIGINSKLKENPKIKAHYPGELLPYIDSRVLNLHTSDPRELRNVIILESDLFATNGNHRILANRGGLYLYEYISRESRGAGYSIFSHDLPFPSNDTFSTARNLIRAIRNSDINYFIVFGSYEDMLSSCRRIIKEKDVK